jgi:amidophosphoribosyltransferase
MCGITGVYAQARDAARLAYFALYALQHRGQESAGIAAADGGTIRSHKAMGLLSAIFDEEVLSDLSGHIAIGHTRYSTSGSSIVVNAQPLLEQTELGDFAFAHNGNLTNTDELRAMLSPSTILQATSDSEVMAKLIVESKGTMLERITEVLRVARGAFSIVLSTANELYAFRDPWGVRPLCLGVLADGGYVVASESCALGTVGAHYLREIERGEIVRISSAGLESFQTDVEQAREGLCMFEYIYFARPDSKLNDRSIYMARYAMGRELAKEHPVDADIVMAVPDSAVAGGIGDDAAHRRAVARGRRKGSPFAHHVAADQTPLLSRRGYGNVRRAHRRQSYGRRDS